jgi:dolichol-phosphate mannosyltransferase
MTSPEKIPELSVVIPVHNEAENLAPLLNEISAALDGSFDYEVVAVDDGSDDGTKERLVSLAHALPRLRVVRHAHRSGQSAALVTGVEAARAPWIATLDGDGQNDPADILRLITAMRATGSARHLGLVIGNRERRADTIIKRISSRLANWVRSRLLHDSTPDTGCGIKVFNREAFLGLPQFDHMHRFLPALFLREGLQVESVAVSHRARRHGSSHYGLFDRLWVGIVDLIGIQWLQRRPIQGRMRRESNGS